MPSSAVMLLLYKAYGCIPCAEGSRGGGEAPSPGLAAGDEETETLDLKKQQRQAQSKTWKDGELLSRKSGSEPLKDMLGIPGVDDRRTEKFLLIQVKGSNLSAVYCPCFIYFYDTVIMCTGLRSVPK